MNSEDDATSTSDRPTSDPRAFLSVSALVNEDITPSSPPVTQSQLHFPSHFTNLPLLPRRCASTPPMTPISQLLEQNSPMLPTPPISEKNTTIVTGYFKPELSNSPERCKRQRTDGDSYALQFRPTVPIPLPKVESTATPTPPTTLTITVDKKDISTSSADSPRRRPRQTNTDNVTLGKPRPLAQLSKATISKPSSAAQFTSAQLQTIKRCHEITQQFNCKITLLPKRMGDALWVELFSARVREAVANELEKQREEGRNLEVNQKDVTEFFDNGDRESRPVAQKIGPSTDKRDVLKGISEHADNELPRATSAYKIGLPTSVSHEPSTSESMTSMTPTALFKRPGFPQNRTLHFRSSSLGNVVPQIISDQESKTPPADGKWTITESCALPHPSILRTNGNGSPLAKYTSKLQYSKTNSNQSGETPDGSNHGTSKVRKRTLHPKSHTSAIHTHTRSLSLDELKFGLNDFQKNRPTTYLRQAGRYLLNPAQPIQSPRAKIGSVREGENGSRGFVTDQRMDRLPLLADQMALSTSYASNPTLQRSHDVYPSQQSLRESHLSVADRQKQIAWDDHSASKQYIPTVTHHRPKSLNEKGPCASTTQARPYVQMIDPADTVHKTSRPFSSEQPTRPYHVATTEPKKETLESKIPATTASSNSFLTDKNCTVTRNSFSTIRDPSLAPFVYHLPPIAHRPAPQSFGNGKRGFSPPWTNSYPEDMSGQDCQMYVRQKVVRSPASSAPSSLPQDKQ